MADHPVKLRVVEAPGARFELRCWGEFALVDDAGHDLSPRGRKARAILAWLAAHPDMPVSRERLAGLLWSDRGEEQARASLRQCLYELRHLSNGGASLLSVAREHVTHNSAALADNGDTGDLRELAARIASSEGMLFRDLDDVSEGFDEWLRAERPRRRAQLVASALEAVEAGVARGDVAGARDLAGALQVLDPLDETIARAAMTADARAGDVAALERRYQRLQKSLASELRVEPSGETQGLHRDLLRQLGREVPPAEEEAPLPGAAVEPVPAAPAPRPRWRRLAPALAAGLVAVLLAAALYWLAPNPFRQANAAPVTLAVLPFRNLAPGDDYFAEGVSEEILGLLAANPRFRVLGRTSASSFKDQSLDAKTLGDKLDVAYLVEGSVRTMADQVRVNVALVRTEDGAQLWAERYDGRLDDIFAIQDRIGAAVAARLGRGPPGSAPAVRAAVTSGDVYGLYLTARGLIRDREQARMDVAIELLRRAIKLDPNFAPARAELGRALILRVNNFGTLKEKDAVKPEALGHVRRALELAPNLAEAHLALGTVLDSDGPEPHTERAARLNPNNPEIWNSLAQGYHYRGDYPRALNAWRRAVAIDPLWWRAQYHAAETAWNMGYREEAQAYVLRVEASGVPFQVHMGRASMAWRRGDFSEEVRHTKAAFNVADEGKRFLAEFGMSRALRALGHYAEARRIWHFYEVDDTMWGMWHGKPPPPGVVRALYSDPVHAWNDWPNIYFQLRTLLNAGRSAEVVKLFDSRYKSPEAMASDHTANHVIILLDSVFVSLALRDVGRTAEADRLIALADTAARKALGKGRVPRQYYFTCAQIWAAQGKSDRALAALDRAISSGWFYGGIESFRDIADEPAFRSLRGHPRFERIRARLAAHIARERRELGPVDL